jgi:pyruvate/2-oxoglutarate dehydrogenase complex dihydrolipoamide acyltransferase (E2) component
MIEIRIPEAIWEGDPEGTLVTWLYEPGDTVPAGAVIAQLMVEKAQVDLVTPAAGVLRIEVPDETAVRRGQVVGYIV